MTGGHWNPKKVIKYNMIQMVSTQSDDLFRSSSSSCGASSKLCASKYSQTFIHCH